MRKWTGLYIFSTCFLLVFFTITSSYARAFQSVENQTKVTANRCETVTSFSNSKESKPADGLLEADGVGTFRICVQERNTISTITSSFFAFNFFPSTDNHSFTAKRNDLITGYLTHIYPSHNFW